MCEQISQFIFMFYVQMATDVEIDSSRMGDRIYSEPDADPYESELEFVTDEHNYSALGEVPDNMTDNDPSKNEVEVTLFFI